jgi:coenzyme F420 hydrogenase subunit beta
MVKPNLTIESVVKNKLCIGCGNCESVCPHQAIALRWLPTAGLFAPGIDGDLCTNCGLCYSSCPGAGLNTGLLSKRFLVSDDTKSDPIVGEYMQVYVGHAADPAIRGAGTSGGIVTALALFALENGMIDGVIASRSRPENPLIPEPFIASTREEVLSAAGSKYCTIPVNRILRQVKETSGSKYMFIGLPCQIQGLRYAQCVDQALLDQVVFCISLLCGRNYSLLATLSTLEKVGISPKEVIQIRYRDQGWPGELCITTKDREVRLDYPEYMKGWSVSGLLWRCVFCSDAFGVLSDVSTGDNWSLRGKETEGESVLIARTENGRWLLNEARQHGSLCLEETGVQELLDSQKELIRFKVHWLGARVRIARLLGKSVPNFCSTNMAISAEAIMHAMVFYARAFLRRGLPRSIAEVVRWRK